MNQDMKKAIDNSYIQHHTHWCKSKSFSLRSDQEKGNLLPQFLFNVVLKSHLEQLGKENKLIGKEEIKLPLFVDDMRICIENLKTKSKIYQLT